MKTLLIATTAAALALSGAVAANAQDVGQVYGSVGYQGTQNDTTDTNVNGINARIGTRLTPYFGIEGEAALGTDSDKGPGGEYKLTNKVAAYGVGFLPVSPRFDLIGRVGVSDTDLKAPAAAGKLEQGTALEYGVGAQYHFDNDLALRADYTKADFNGDKGEAGTTSVSLIKKF
ncbi:porin family protein [Asticcacaulis sp. AC402]|uniref:porin family protein n=1 Tax=Asticcacaulis sp. AC402 TaxID=1282361 RepID=UPI0003C4035A|nr:porin family protein [Asticcacaulis sp. AC402]ESQ74008.1 flagellar motor protein MotB [Asticcacaulis sp. AC402]